MSIIKVDVHVKVDPCEHCRTQKPHLGWNVGPVSAQTLKGPVGVPVMLQLTDTQQCKISVAPVDKKGAPAPVQSVGFVSSDPNVATVTPDPTDASSALVVAGLPGTCQITAAVDTDLGDGVNNVTATLDITVVGGAAVTLAVTAGTPVEQPGS